MEDKVLQDLVSQRDTILFGKWVQRSPLQNGEACLLVRQIGGQIIDLSQEAREILYRLFYGTSGKNAECPMEDLTNWNDLHAEEEEVLAILDEAITWRKEQLDGN